MKSLENWSEKTDVTEELKSMNIKVNFDCDPFKEVLATNGKEKTILKFSRPAFYLVKRGVIEGSLDQGLKEQAFDNGVIIHFGKTVPEEKADILATGPIIRETFAIDKGIIFRADCKDMAIGLVHDDAAYKGYSYLLVTKGYGCMCTVLFDHFKDVHRCFEATKNMFWK